MTLNTTALTRPLLLSIAIAACGVAHAADAPSDQAEGDSRAAQIDKGCKVLSEALLDALGKGDYTTAGKSFNNEMKKALPASKLRESWESLLTNFGPPQMRGDPQGKRDKGLAAIYTPLKFQRGNLVSQVACDVDGKIAGFYVLPEMSSQPANPAKPVKPVDPVQF